MEEENGAFLWRDKDVGVAMRGEGEGPRMDPGLGHLEEKDSVGPSLTRAWALEPEPLLCRWPQVLEGNLTLLTRQ